MDDKELELKEHLAELRTRVLRILLAFLFVTPITFFFSKDIFEHFWYKNFNFPPYVFSPLEWVLVQLIIAFLFSFLILYPYIIYEIYQFSKPGLYEKERNYFKFLMTLSYVVFVSIFLISMNFLVPVLYSITISNSFDPYFSALKTAENAFKISIAIGISSQIPLAMFLAVKFRIVEYEALKNFRIVVYFAALIFITNISLEFASLANLIGFLTFCLMYELGLLLLRIGNSIYLRR